MGDRGQWLLALTTSPAGLARGEGLWQPLTAVFVAPSGSLGTWALMLVLAWSMGSRLEDFWGSGRFLLFSGAIAFGSYASLALWGLLWPEQFGPQLRAGGPFPINLAVCLAFAIVFARTEFRPFGMSAMTGRVIGYFLAFLVALSACVGASLTGGLGVQWSNVALLPATLLISSGFLFQPWRRGARSRTGQQTTAAERVANAKHLRLLN